jgi:GGDEF domain-containing protein
MARVAVRDVMSTRRRGNDPEPQRDVPTGFAPAAAASTRQQPQPHRAGNFLEVAEATADTLRRLLGVDRVMILRVFGTSLADLADSPHTPARYGKGIAGADEPDAYGNRPNLLTLAVEQVAEETGAFGSAGAGMYSPDGALIGVVVALSEDRLPWEGSVYAEALAHHAKVLGMLLSQEIQEVAAGRAEDARAVGTMLDELTKMPDRRAWGLLIRQEEERAASLGHPAAVLVIDAGPTNSGRTLRRMVTVLREIAGEAPALCRLDDRLWGVLVTGLTADETDDLAIILAEGLDEAGGKPAIGIAERGGGRDLVGAWSLADERMFLARRTSRPVIAG